MICSDESSRPTAFLFKQGGMHLASKWECSDRKGGKWDEIPEEFRVREYPHVP